MMKIQKITIALLAVSMLIVGANATNYQSKLIDKKISITDPKDTREAKVEKIMTDISKTLNDENYECRGLRVSNVLENIRLFNDTLYANKDAKTYTMRPSTNSLVIEALSKKDDKGIKSVTDFLSMNFLVDTKTLQRELVDKYSYVRINKVNENMLIIRFCYEIDEQDVVYVIDKKKKEIFMTITWEWMEWKQKV